MLYESAWNELKSYIPTLSVLQAQKLVNRAWRDIKDSRRWSFLKAETVIQTPATVNNGSVTVTQSSATVVGDAAANVAWAAIAADLPNRIFRLGLGPIYTIASYTPPNLILNFPYGESSAATQAYQIIKMYYPAPMDFTRWESIIDPVSAYAFILDWTKEELDRADPQRGAINLPHRMVSYKFDQINKLWLYEMWPAPTVIRNYMCLYQRQGVDLVNGQEQDSVIPDLLLMAKAKILAYEWAEANKGVSPQLRPVNWLALRGAMQAEFPVLLHKAFRNDEEHFIQNFATNYLYPAYSGLTFSSNYWQSHAPILYY